MILFYLKVLYKPGNGWWYHQFSLINGQKMTIMRAVNYKWTGYQQEKMVHWAEGSGYPYADYILAIDKLW